MVRHLSLPNIKFSDYGTVIKSGDLATTFHEMGTEQTKAPIIFGNFIFQLLLSASIELSAVVFPLFSAL